MQTARVRRLLGQSGTEYMLVISVITIAVVGAAYAFVDPFSQGVNDLGNDVKEILGGESIGGVGRDGGNNVNGSSPTTDPQDGGTDSMGTPSNPGGRSYDGRSFSNNDTFAYDPNAANDPMRDILGGSTQDRLNGYPGGPVMTASAPRAEDGTELACADIPLVERMGLARREEA